MGKPSFKKRNRVKKEKEIEKQLLHLYSGKNIQDKKQEIDELENELKQIRDEKIQGIILRVKAKCNIEGERSSKYFCNLEKRNFTDKIIVKIILDEKEINSSEENMKAQENFHRSL